MTEEWKPIKDYEGLYEASNLGNIKSLERSCSCGKDRIRTVPETILKQQTDKDGYKYVVLQKEGKRKVGKVHRLVLSSFNPIENANEKEVNHIDGNPANNNIDNLEWCEQSYNLWHSYYILKGHEEHYQSIPIKITNANGEVKKYGSVKEASDILKIDRHVLSRALYSETHYCKKHNIYVDYAG